MGAATTSQAARVDGTFGSAPASDARRWLVTADILAVCAGILLAIGLRRTVGMDPTEPFDWSRSHRPLFLVFGICLVFRLGMAGQYDRGRRFQRIDDSLVVVRAAFVAAAVAIFLSAASKGFFTGFINYSRAYVLLGFALPILLVLLVRLIGHAAESRAFASGRYLARVLVVGGGARAERFARSLADNVWMGRAALSSELRAGDEPDAWAQVIGSELDQLRPDEVVLALDEPRSDVQVAVLREAVPRGIAVKVLPGVFESYQSEYFEYGGQPVTTLFETPGRRFSAQLKVVLDRAIATLGLLAISPLLALVALAVKLEDRGPVFYFQDRVGLHGRRFRVAKFRSMRVDADAHLDALLERDATAREQWAAYQKLDPDPRITRVGRFIRAWSLDELPQLWNVAMGEMSLVGPRPPMPDQLDEYGVRFVFSQVRPGVTGPWQVAGRNELTFQERVELEVAYVENWSLARDVKILLKTVGVVAAGSGK